FQFELESLETRNHSAEFVPGNLPAINDEQRRAPALFLVPINPTSNHQRLCNLQTVLAVGDVLYGKSASHLFDQSAEQCELVFLRLGNDLEMVARRIAVAEFERVQGDAHSKQKGAEMK